MTPCRRALTLLVRVAGDGAAVEGLLNHKSGVLGLSGMSADIRDVVARAADGRAADIDQLAVAAQVYVWRMRKYLGAYLTLVGRVHCVIFTDTIGEKMPHVRWAVTAGLQCFNLDIDPKKNDAVRALPADLSTTTPPAWSCTGCLAARSSPSRPPSTRTPLPAWSGSRASHRRSSG